MTKTKTISSRHFFFDEKKGTEILNFIMYLKFHEPIGYFLSVVSNIVSESDNE